MKSTVKQKFWRGHKVMIGKPNGPIDATAGKEAIVCSSSRDQEFGGRVNGEDEYTLLVIDKGGNYIQAWFYESGLTLIDSDRDKGEELLQEYQESVEDDEEDYEEED